MLEGALELAASPDERIEIAVAAADPLLASGRASDARGFLLGALDDADGLDPERALALVAQVGLTRALDGSGGDEAIARLRATMPRLDGSTPACGATQPGHSHCSMWSATVRPRRRSGYARRTRERGQRRRGCACRTAAVRHPGRARARRRAGGGAGRARACARLLVRSRVDHGTGHRPWLARPDPARSGQRGRDRERRARVALGPGRHGPQRA